MSDPLMQYFTWDHLPAKLQEVSKPFCALAQIIEGLPRNPERTVALRKLLEAKDCAVRAMLWKDEDRPREAPPTPPDRPRGLPRPEF